MTQKRFNSMYILKMSLFIVGIILVLAILVKTAIFLIPFVIAFTVSMLMEPLVKLMVNKLRIPRKGASGIALLLVLATVGYLISLLISKLVSEIASLTHQLPKYYNEVYNNLNDLMMRANELYVDLPPEVTNNIKSVVSSLTSSLADIVNKLAKGLFTTAISLPQALVFTLVTILATYFFSSDRERIFVYFKSHLPDSWIHKMGGIKTELFSALFGYVRAQLIMMTITFTELFIGFSIIGIKYTLLLAFCISIIDALPILGTGGVVIPWASYMFLVGDFRTGVSLMILYVIVLAVRQMIEPKVLSHQIGLHPLVTLTAMYSGLQLFGVGGLILGPVSVLICKNIFTGVVHSGTIKEFLNQIRPPEGN